MIVALDLSVLIVDDNEYALALAKDALKKMGLKSIFCAKDATTGLQLAQNNVLDFVLLDWYMPDINGAGFVRLVHGGQAGCSPDLPIIVTTAYASRENTRRIRELGLKDILVKPFDSRQLAIAISSALSKGNPSANGKPTRRNNNDQILL